MPPQTSADLEQRRRLGSAGCEHHITLRVGASTLFSALAGRLLRPCVHGAARQLHAERDGPRVATRMYVTNAATRAMRRLVRVNPLRLCAARRARTPWQGPCRLCQPRSSSRARPCRGRQTAAAVLGTPSAARLRRSSRHDTESAAQTSVEAGMSKLAEPHSCSSGRHKCGASSEPASCTCMATQRSSKRDDAAISNRGHVSVMSSQVPIKWWRKGGILAPSPRAFEDDCALSDLQFRAAPTIVGPRAVQAAAPTAFQTSAMLAEGVPSSQAPII